MPLSVLRARVSGYRHFVTRAAAANVLAALALAATPGPLAGKTVAIDPGHNAANYLHTAEINRLVNAGTLYKACDTTGTATDDGSTQPAYNLDVALRPARPLRAARA